MHEFCTSSNKRSSQTTVRMMGFQYVIDQNSDSISDQLGTVDAWLSSPSRSDSNTSRVFRQDKLGGFRL